MLNADEVGLVTLCLKRHRRILVEVIVAADRHGILSRWLPG